MNVVQEFTEWRQSQNFSISEAARKINVDRGSYRQMERGERKCPPQIARKMIEIAILPRLAKEDK